MVATGATQARRAHCDEKLRLAHEYNTYTAQYSRSVKLMHQRIGVSSRLACGDVLRSTEEARELSEKARQALDHHLSEHGC